MLIKYDGRKRLWVGALTIDGQPVYIFNQDFKSLMENMFTLNNGAQIQAGGFVADGRLSEAQVAYGMYNHTTKRDRK